MFTTESLGKIKNSLKFLILILFIQMLTIMLTGTEWTDFWFLRTVLGFSKLFLIRSRILCPDGLRLQS